ncbi:hypothetical protein F5Y14DRAFT_463593 [Nemania sp. NC0429]|nr:hypothetical protein F5Y14DRAFT_463593 [Nemania sp. NC0429]
MSGFEIIGVVLGSIPLLISALEHYERGIKTIQIIRRHARVMQSLALKLGTEQTILRNTCETLLGGIIDPRDMKPMLEEPFGQLWQNPDTKALVEQRLDHTLKDFEALVHSMRETVEEIRSKLGLGLHFEIRIDDSPIGTRNIVKIALRFSTYEESLKRLADINQKLDLMTTGNLRNEPYRKIRSPEKLYNLLQTISRSIHNSLRSSLSCSCAQSHGVGFSLPAPRAPGRVQGEEALVKRLSFHVILANKPQDSKGKSRSSWKWDELTLRQAELPIETCTTALLPAATDVVEKKSKLFRVKFFLGKERHQNVTEAATSIPLPLTETQKPRQLKDICRTLSEKRLDVQRQASLGYLLDETPPRPHMFEVFPSKVSWDDDECTTIHLGGVFSQGHRPSLARKYHIAAMAASSVLFMHNTPWMLAILTIEDVFLISRHGNVAFDEIYLERTPLHDLERSTIAPNYGSSSLDAPGVSTLLHLGIFLVEVKPIYEFWDDGHVDTSNTPLDGIFDYTTDKGSERVGKILKAVEGISSPEFKEVVEHCIKCDFNASHLSLDNDTFRQAVYQDIVLPLQDADQLASGKMIVGKRRLARTI